MYLSELYFRQISSPYDIFRCGSSRIGEYWQVPTWRHFTTIIMSWNMVDPRSQMRFEIVWDKCWDLLNNIGLTYWCLNMRLVLNIFFKIEQVPAYIELIKNYQLKKIKKHLIMNYIATVISNLSNIHIHLYWTGPPTFISNGKSTGRCSIESKNYGGNIISSLHIVSTIFFWSLSMWSTFNLLEHIPVHLPFEVKVGGPVQYRWMYPFERLDITVAM